MCFLKVFNKLRHAIKEKESLLLGEEKGGEGEGECEREGRLEKKYKYF